MNKMNRANLLMVFSFSIALSILVSGIYDTIVPDSDHKTFVFILALLNMAIGAAAFLLGMGKDDDGR